MKSSGKSIRVVLKSYDCLALDVAVDHVVKIAKQERVKYKGPIPLPVKKKRWTVNRSPHIDKESREQFEQRTHKRLIYVEATSAFIDAIGRHSLASGVGAKIILNNEGNTK